MSRGRGMALTVLLGLALAIGVVACLTANVGTLRQIRCDVSSAACASQAP